MMADNFLSPNPNPTHPDSRPRAVSDADTITPDGTNPFLTPSGTTAAPSAAPSFLLEDPDSALHPDPGTEHDFRVDNNPFAFSPGQLNKLFNPKSLSAFRALGGLQGVARGIQTDVRSGLSVDETGVKSTVSFSDAVDFDSKPATPTERHATTSSTPFADRTRIYGRNVLPPKKGKSILRLMYIELSEKVIILLTVAGVISLALGLYETLGVERPAGSPASVDWYVLSTRVHDSRLTVTQGRGRGHLRRSHHRRRRRFPQQLAERTGIRAIEHQEG